MKGIEKVPILRFTGEQKRMLEGIVVRESVPTIFLNNQEMVALLCSRGKLKYLALGFLYSEGLKLGSAALSPASTKSAELIIVDEFGPLEIHGCGWCKYVDSLFSSSNATILLVVRRELAEQVRQLYANVPSRKLSASKPESIGKVLTILRSHRGC